ncbi:MAG: hypothetical protein IJU45_07265 [Clostridia bacterium]|nr:hypothetical protein [Clostridia bacterium]
MKKRAKIILGVLGVLALLGICFASLSIYAKKEINKPKFELPEMTEQQGSPLPATKEEAFSYVDGIYQKIASADDIEMNMHTDVHTGGEKALPFSSADNEVISRVLEKAQGNLGALYPKSENVLLSKTNDFPTLGFTAADITDFTAEKGRIDESGKTVDEEYYFITFTVNPERIDKQAMLSGDVRERIEDELSPVLSVSSLEIAPEGFTASFKIRHYDDTPVHIEFKRSVKIKASVDFVMEPYQKISKDTVQVELPYETVQIIDLFHYGIHFTERQIAVQKNDMQALPLEVNVNAATTKEDYKLKFDVSKDGLLEIDEDGVMTVKSTQEEPLTVTATLDYDGHTYTDKLIVYATELEVKTDEPTGN